MLFKTVLRAVQGPLPPSPSPARKGGGGPSVAKTQFHISSRQFPLASQEGGRSSCAARSSTRRLRPPHHGKPHKNRTARSIAYRLFKGGAPPSSVCIPGQRPPLPGSAEAVSQCRGDRPVAPTAMGTPSRLGLPYRLKAPPNPGGASRHAWRTNVKGRQECLPHLHTPFLNRSTSRRAGREVDRFANKTAIRDNS